MVRFRRPGYDSEHVLRLLKAPRRQGPAGEVPGEPVDPLRSLAQAATHGDENAQSTLLVTLGPSLLGAVRGVLGVAHRDLEDVLQEAMAAVHRALPAFRGECKTVHFACRVAVQTAMNARRRAGYRARYTPSTPPEELAHLARDERSPADERAAAERRNALRRLLDELPPVQAEALALHVVLGYSVDETAAATGAPRDTVRSRLRAGLSALRRRVEADGVLFEVLGGSP
jgi:RNA polymerase sigma-70 factor (ECF subfamily)